MTFIKIERVSNYLQSLACVVGGSVVAGRKRFRAAKLREAKYGWKGGGFSRAPQQQHRQLHRLCKPGQKPFLQLRTMQALTSEITLLPVVVCVAAILSRYQM